MSLGTLGASLLGNLLAGKERHNQSNWSRPGFVMQDNLLRNFETQNYYQNEPKFNGFYSTNNLPKIKDGAYVINLEEL